MSTNRFVLREWRFHLYRDYFAASAAAATGDNLISQRANKLHPDEIILSWWYAIQYARLRYSARNESCTIAHASPDFYSVPSFATSPLTKRRSGVHTRTGVRVCVCIYIYVVISLAELAVCGVCDQFLNEAANGLGHRSQNLNTAPRVCTSLGLN